MVLDSILNGRDYETLEPELIADWRAHYLQNCTHLRDSAVAALRRARETLQPADAQASEELAELEHRLAPA